MSHHTPKERQRKEKSLPYCPRSKYSSGEIFPEIRAKIIGRQGKTWYNGTILLAPAAEAVGENNTVQIIT